MPTNKKNKSKKKRDKLNKVIDFSTSSNINAASLSKQLPHAAAQLRDGTMDPNEMAEELSHLFLKEKLGQNMDPQLKLKHNPDVRLGLTETVYGQLVAAIFGQDEGIDEDAKYQFYKELVTTENELASEIYDQNKRTNTKRMECMQKAYEQVTDRWVQAGRIPIQNNNRFFNASFEDFEKDMVAVLNLNFDLNEDAKTQIRETMTKGEDAKEVYKDIMAAAKGVVNGDDLIKNSCWNCDKPDPTKVSLMSCSQCHIAVYCSQECQLAHWKHGGHKAKCKGLHSQYDRYKVNQHRVDEAVADGRVVTGPLVVNHGQEQICHLKPYPLLDYTLTVVMALTDTHFEGIQGPSMDIFYTNIAKVACGGTHPAFRERNGQYQSTQKFLHTTTLDRDEIEWSSLLIASELQQMEAASTILCYDTSESSPEVVDEFERYIDQQLTTPYSQITLDRYLEVYVLQGNLPHLNKLGPKHRYEADLKVYLLMKGGE